MTRCISLKNCQIHQTKLDFLIFVTKADRLMKNHSILKTSEMNCTSRKNFPAFVFFFKLNRLSLLFSMSGVFFGFFWSLKLDVLIQFGSEFDVISDGCLCHSRPQ